MQLLVFLQYIYLSVVLKITTRHTNVSDHMYCCQTVYALEHGDGTEFSHVEIS
jgi:hypothetical protein